MNGNKSDSKLIDALIFTLGYLLVLVIFILTIVGYNKAKNTDLGFFTELGSNWLSGPILDIQVSYDNQCSLGYSNLFNQSWPGLTSGCDCSMLSDPYIVARTCKRVGNKGRRLKEYPCRDLPMFDPVPFTSWSFKSFCGKRLEGNYLDYEIVSDPNKCSDSSRSCGVIDTLGNYICIDKKLTCPLNNIRIENGFFNKSDTFTQYNKGNETYYVVFNNTIDARINTPEYKNYVYSTLNDKNLIVDELSYGKALILDRKKNNGNVLIDLFFAQKRPCIDESFFDLDFNEYPTSNSFLRNGCPSFNVDGVMVKDDPRPEQLDNDYLYNFYGSNGINNLLDYLPLYIPPNKTNTVTLYKRQYNYISESCRSMIKSKYANTTEFLTSLKNFKSSYTNEIHGYLYAAKVLNIIVFSCASLYFLTIGIVYLCGFDHCKIVNTIFSLNFSFGLTLLILNAVGAAKLNHLPKQLMILIDNKCLDKYITPVLFNVKSEFDKAKSLFIASAILSAIYFFIYPFLVVATHGIDNEDYCYNKNKGQSGLVDDEERLKEDEKNQNKNPNENPTAKENDSVINNPGGIEFNQ